MKTRIAIAGTMAVVGLLGCWQAIAAAETELNSLVYSIIVMGLGGLWLCLLGGKYGK
jgi:hypothetical protein